MTYEEFLSKKRLADPSTGVEPLEITAPLFEFQKDLVRWGIRRGRAAFFEDCGLGKTIQQLEWARQVSILTNKPVLIIAPLGVVQQSVAEGLKFGLYATHVTSESQVGASGVYITNYEKLHRFDASVFSGVALDESSILKSYDGKTRTALIEAFRVTPFRSAWTATPSPNDLMEIGNHAEFLGVMTRAEMLSTFFVHDGGDTSKWRLKGHAESDFWKWMCSWSVNIRKPSDLGYSDEGFTLPPLEIKEHVVSVDAAKAGWLIPMPVSSLQERREARRASLSSRVKKSVEIALESRNALIWCNLNDEQHEVERQLGASCVSIEGSTDGDDRVELERTWRTGPIPFLTSKPEIFGFGMNWQHCDTAIYCGLSDSFEDFYQSIRRCWRFGQQRPVTAHIVISNLEDAVLSNIKRKQNEADRMAGEMVRHMASISSAEIKGTKRTMTNYKPAKEMEFPSWLNGSSR